MQTFQDYAYQRPVTADFRQQFENAIAQLRKETEPASLLAALKKIETLRADWDTMYNLCYIRHTVNTADEFYAAEKEFFSSNQPLYQELEAEFFRLLPDLPHQEVLRREFGDQLFIIAELMQKTFHPSIIDDLKEENKLTDEYIKLISQANIPFRGETYNLSGIGPFEKSDDRETRREAATAKWDFYAAHVAEIEGIYDRLVKLRAGMASKLGFDNFITMGYYRMLRSDYDHRAVARFRDQVTEHIVPVVQELIQRQATRLGVDKMHFYDEPVIFRNGNPKPSGSADEIVAAAGTMYDELSPETGEFFRFMEDRGLLDLTTKENKAPMGYCTFLSKYKSPFIFSNFNGTSDDIDVLTHEAGHAFQGYMSRPLEQLDYRWPTADAAEIHSMAMEFFAWPWMELFFGDDADKYRFGHMIRSLTFLPYGVLVDEFQHEVFSAPDMSPAERNAVWRRLEKKYLPHRSYDGNGFLDEGRFWQRQNHIFGLPFYYIDYALAQICALQFWVREGENRTEAWKDYLNICKVGGSRSFLSIVKLGGLMDPFGEGCVKTVAGKAMDWLRSIDDSRF